MQSAPAPQGLTKPGWQLPLMHRSAPLQLFPSLHSVSLVHFGCQRSHVPSLHWESLVQTTPTHAPPGQSALPVQETPLLVPLRHTLEVLSDEHREKYSAQVRSLSPAEQHNGVTPGSQPPPAQYPVPGTAQSSSLVQSAPSLPLEQVSETVLQVPGV